MCASVARYLHGTERWNAGGINNIDSIDLLDSVDFYDSIDSREFDSSQFEK